MAELISTILCIIKDISNHIQDYMCNDVIIDNIFHKIISIYPHIENLKEQNDEVTNQNCQRLYVLICKIKKEIKDFKSKSSFKKFFITNNLKEKCIEFNTEIEHIFKNLKFNLIIKNNRNSDNLINYKQEEIDYLKQTISAKYISNDIKKSIINDILIINNKIELIMDYINKNKNNMDYDSIINVLNDNIKSFNDNLLNINYVLNNIDNNINIITNNIMFKKITYFKYFFIGLSFIIIIIIFFNNPILDQNRIYT